MYLCETIGCGNEADAFDGNEPGTVRYFCRDCAVENDILMPDEFFVEDEYCLPVQELKEDFG